MIISHKHKYIFIHNRKTAGSSITVSLARDFGQDDIQIGSFMDTSKCAIKPNKMAFRTALSTKTISSYLLYLLKSRSFDFALDRAIKAYYQSLSDKPAHATASEIKRFFPREWKDYKKFCVVRNTYEKTVSDYFWRTRKMGKDRPSFKDYVQLIADNNKFDEVPTFLNDNWNIYTIDDQIAVDQVIRFENLQNDLSSFFNEINYDWDGWLPNSKKIDKSSSYRNLYDSETIDLVTKIFEKEIIAFNYEF